MPRAFAFVRPYTPKALDALTPTELAQLGGLETACRGGPWDGQLKAVPLGQVTRYDVVADGEHLYDAWVVGGWVPVAVFARGGREVLAWWGDQDSGAVDGFEDLDDLCAAHAAVTRQ